MRKQSFQLRAKVKGNSGSSKKMEIKNFTCVKAFLCYNDSFCINVFVQAKVSLPAYITATLKIQLSQSRTLLFSCIAD